MFKFFLKIFFPVLVLYVLSYLGMRWIDVITFESVFQGEGTFSAPEHFINTIFYPLEVIETRFKTHLKTN